MLQFIYGSECAWHFALVLPLPLPAHKKEHNFIEEFALFNQLDSNGASAEVLKQRKSHVAKGGKQRPSADLLRDEYIRCNLYPCNSPLGSILLPLVKPTERFSGASESHLPTFLLRLFAEYIVGC